MTNTPFKQIKKHLSEDIPEDLIKKIPDKWEKIGDVLILTISKDLKKYYKTIGKAYSEILNCKTVLNDIGGIKGEYRKPNVKRIYGTDETETVHKENGIKFKIDPKKIMFSSGNMDERLRMAKISNNNEIVVDLFAGIGYFTLPMAVYSKPKKIIACEKNPTAYKYLCENIVLNNVVDIVEPLKGDNRITAPKNIANRVIVGYIGETNKFISTAFDCLKNRTGIIHFHDKFPEKDVPKIPLNNIQKIADEKNNTAKLLKFKHVKSYAPGIGHYVFDIGIEKI